MEAKGDLLVEQGLETNQEKLPWVERVLPHLNGLAVVQGEAPLGQGHVHFVQA